jgi:hypothetical protein
MLAAPLHDAVKVHVQHSGLLRHFGGGTTCTGRLLTKRT